MIEEDHVATPPKQWIGKWLRQEAFWRDLFKSAIAALIAIAIAYYVGLASGFIASPHAARDSAEFVGWVIAMGIYGIVAVYLYAILVAIVGAFVKPDGFIAGVFSWAYFILAVYGMVKWIELLMWFVPIVAKWASTIPF